ncbi:MAG: H-type lectin domain-containing protein [Verrucomicrobiales bacterium]|nr:H-type lectin domain-containing protein [Verrucomicrobiales bacterium]HQW27754.1 H-type lectin domain-containing protein [Verrucomicrobiales bacterium]
MNDDYLPWKILSATVVVGTETENWNLAIPADEEDSARCFTLEIYFATPFTTPPVVHLGLTGFDIDQCSSGRIKVVTEAVTTDGFLAKISTWRSSRVYSVEFNWLAVGA